MKYHIETTKVFDQWWSNLKDKKVRFRLEARFDRILQGHFGDQKKLTHDVYELRCFFAGGIRVYYTIKRDCVVILMCAGTKSTQNKDIALARTLVQQLEDN